MAVMMPNTTLTLRRKEHSYSEDSHGVKVAGASWSAPVGPVVGAIVTPEDGDTSAAPRRFRADIALDPISPDDELTDAEGRVYIVRTARRNVVPGYDYLDHIGGTAELTPPYSP